MQNLREFKKQFLGCKVLLEPLVLVAFICMGFGAESRPEENKLSGEHFGVPAYWLKYFCVWL